MLKIYIEQDFLKELEKILKPFENKESEIELLNTKDMTYGVRFLYELAEEKHMFILDQLPFNEVGRCDSSTFTKKIDSGNAKAFSKVAVENAHLLFVTKQRGAEIKTSGLVFTIEDFEKRIEEYAQIENFINFLQSDVNWIDLLSDFKKFPFQNLHIVDEYFFDHIDNPEFFNKIFNTPLGPQESVKIYINSKKVSMEKGKTFKDKKKEKINLIKEVAASLKNSYNFKNIEINRTESHDEKGFTVNWHDREIVSDYAMVIAGSGFKKEYKPRTNNKLVQFNIFTKNGRRLIKEQKQKFQEFEDTIDAKYRLFNIQN